jgi:hypothetical protein
MPEVTIYEYNHPLFPEDKIWVAREVLCMTFPANIDVGQGFT